MGGTGVSNGGIGGTGAREDGGIGGTGIQAAGELGLIGVVTGFASLCINGVEVHYEAATPVLLNGQPASSDALAIGQVVAVRAVASGKGAQAQWIHIADAAVGQVTRADAPSGLLHVEGQPVRLQPSTVFAAGLSRENIARPGERVSVSGLRAADGSVVATRIARPAAEARPFAGGAPPEDLGSGRFIVTGFVSAPTREGELRVSGAGFSVEGQAERLPPDALVRIAGRVQRDGRRVVERVERLASPLATRPETGPRPSEMRREGSGPGRSEALERSERSGRDQQPDRSGRSERGERPERVDRSGSGRGERPERPERVDRSGRH
jgi:hypothetical protein